MNLTHEEYNNYCNELRILLKRIKIEKAICKQIYKLINSKNLTQSEKSRIERLIEQLKTT